MKRLTCFSSSNSTSTSSSIWGEIAVTTNVRKRAEVLFTCVNVPPALDSDQTVWLCLSQPITVTRCAPPSPPSPAKDATQKLTFQTMSILRLFSSSSSSNVGKDVFSEG